MSSPLNGTVLKKKWRLGELVGSGGCANVYAVTDIRTEGPSVEPLVAKVAPLPSGLPPAMTKGKKRKKTEQEKHADMLYYEYTLYNGYLRGHGGVPQLPHGGYGEDQNMRFLVMTRLGSDVEAAQKKTGPWSIARQAGYARQMLALLRSLHEQCKMVFVDVKPENFMFGLPGSSTEDKIFLIDFGLSERYTGAAGVVKPQKQSAQVAGTPEFLSVRCHAGGGAGRCDDLESLGYVFLAMLKDGSLPWSGTTTLAQGLAAKKSTSLEELCAGFPSGLLRYMQLVRGMSYDEAPDYDALDKLLQDVAKAGGSTMTTMEKGTTATRAKGSKPARVLGGARNASQDGESVGASASAPIPVPDVENAPPAKSQKGKAKAAPKDMSTVKGQSTGTERGEGVVGDKRKSSEKPAASRRGRSAASDKKRALAAVEPAVNVPDDDDEEEARASPAKRTGRRADSRGGAGSGVAAGAAASHEGKICKIGAGGRRGTSPASKLPVSLSSLIGGRSITTPTRTSPRRTRKAEVKPEDLDEENEEFFDARETNEQNDAAHAGRKVRGKRVARSDDGTANGRKGGSANSAPDAANAEEFLLEVLTGPHKGQKLPVTSAGVDFRVGRGAPGRRGLRLDHDLEVSERHAVLRLSTEGLRCEDIGSLNGTFVNEEKIQSPKIVRDGDVLQVGQSAVRITRSK